MKKIEDIMDEKRELLNREVPQEGHFERFGQKLKNQNSRRLLIHNLYSISRIAAVIIFVVMSAVVIKYSYNRSAANESNVAVAASKQEMNEAEQFYARLLELSYDNIRKIKFPDEAQKAKLLEEVSQKDESLTKIKEDLQIDPSNEIAQQAMINYYETRLEVVNQIVENLKQVLNNNS